MCTPWLRPLFFLLGLFFLGCGEEPRVPQDGERFTDDLGRQVVFVRPVKRVLTLAPNLTEIVCLAGGAHRLAGASEADDYPPLVETLPRFTAFPIDYERIAALAPDLVLATDQVNNPEAAKTLAALGIPTLFFSFDALTDVPRVLRAVGGLLGTERQAEAAADSLERTAARLRALTDGVAHRPSVLFLVDDETLHAFGPESYVHDLIVLAGGHSATADLTTRAPILSEEYVLTRQPDVIIGSFGSDYDPMRLLALHPTWKLVPALRNRRVYSIDGSLIFRPGPRLLEGARRMAQMLHPDLFEKSLAGDA